MLCLFEYFVFFVVKNGRRIMPLNQRRQPRWDLLMKVLITGAFGFVGTNLSAYLAERGHELWALDLLRPPSGRNDECKTERADERKNAQRSSGGTGGANVCLPENAECRNGRGAYARCFGWDELDAIPWNEVDAVVHLAGKAHDTRNTSDPQSYFDVNVGLTKRVLEAWGGGEETQRTQRAQRKM